MYFLPFYLRVLNYSKFVSSLFILTACIFGPTSQILPYPSNLSLPSFNGIITLHVTRPNSFDHLDETIPEQPPTFKFEY
jgi:hypothetical protein